jgi:hypothetical protein
MMRRPGGGGDNDYSLPVHHRGWHTSVEIRFQVSVIRWIPTNWQVSLAGWSTCRELVRILNFAKIVLFSCLHPLYPEFAPSFIGFMLENIPYRHTLKQSYRT